MIVALAASMAAAGCTPKTQAPNPLPATAQNACMQIMSPAGQPVVFRPVAYSDPNLETCAMHLEGVRIEQRRDVRGAWNGVYIYADAAGIDSASDPRSGRYAIYTADQRKQIDDSLTQQLADQKAGRGASSQR